MFPELVSLKMRQAGTQIAALRVPGAIGYQDWRHRPLPARCQSAEGVGAKILTQIYRPHVLREEPVVDVFLGAVVYLHVIGDTT